MASRRLKVALVAHQVFGMASLRIDLLLDHCKTLGLVKAMLREFSL